MADRTESVLACDQCGATNEANAQFCVNCDTYLGWDSGSGTLAGHTLTFRLPAPAELSAPTGAGETAAPSPDTGPHTSPPNDQSPPGPPAERGAADPGGRAPSAAERDWARAPRAELSASEITLDVEVEASEDSSAVAGTFDVRVFNTSTIVDGYRITATSPPPWLSLHHDEVRLRPEQDATVAVSLKVRPRTLVFAQRVRLQLQIRSIADAAKQTGAEIVLIVPPRGGPVTIRTEPAQIQLRDKTAGRLRILLDNSGSNYLQRYELSGSDPAGEVRFSFAPQVIGVAPGRNATVELTFEAPAPEPGGHNTRRLTITAANDQHNVAASVDISQSTSQAAPLRIRLSPSVIRVRDNTGAEFDVVVNNTGARTARRVQFVGRDPTGDCRISFYNNDFLTPPGQESHIRARIEAPAPLPGQETSRPFTITASDGEHELEASGTFVQNTSAAAISTAVLRLEPEHLVVRDHPSARARITVDNSRSQRGLQVRLAGKDPERAVDFQFRPPALEVPPGQTRYAEALLTARPPASGSKADRDITIAALAGADTIEVKGRFTQISSDSAMKTAQIRVEPQHVNARNRSTGRLRVMVDNRRGALPLRAHLTGADQQNQVGFSFAPPVLEIPPGQAGYALLTVRAGWPPGGSTVTHQLRVAAEDHTGYVETTAMFTQSSSPLLPIARFSLTIIGAIIAALGALQPWTDQPALENYLTELPQVNPANFARLDWMNFMPTTQPPARLVVLVLAALMLFGLTSATGRLTRLAAMVLGAGMVALAIFINYEPNLGASPSTGVYLVIIGAVMGLIGGFCVKRR